MLAATALLGLAMAAAASSEDLTAEFKWTPTFPSPGQEVTFTSTGTGAVKYDWDLDGNGTYEIENGATTVRHTYTEAGTYHVRLRVTGADAHTATRTHDVRVSTGMVADFTWSPQDPVKGEKVTFTSTSTVKSGSITKYEWDLDGDKKFDEAQGSTASTTFTKTGSYTVGLRTTDNTGARSFAFDTVQVADSRPEPPTSEPAPSPAPPPPPPAAPSGPAWLNPFPTVRIRGRATPHGVRLNLFAIRAPAGSAVKVTCKGRRCPKHPISRTMKTDRIRIRRFERFIPAKTKVSVFVWKKGLVGKYTSFHFRRLVAPARTDMCLYPGGRWPGRCPR
jgi:plastocyanin